MNVNGGLVTEEITEQVRANIRIPVRGIHRSPRLSSAELQRSRKLAAGLPSAFLMLLTCSALIVTMGLMKNNAGVVIASAALDLLTGRQLDTVRTTLLRRGDRGSLLFKSLPDSYRDLSVGA